MRRQTGADTGSGGDLERRWLADCRKGDAGACAAIVRGYQDIALRTAYLMTNDRQAAEDVAQNAFLSAIRSLGRFDLERPFRPWFLAILANEARMFLRTQRRHPATPLDVDVPDAVDAEVMIARLIRDDERRRVRDALMALDEPYRTTVILHYFNDLSIEEISAATDAPSGTVKSRLHRGREQLRAVLASENSVIATDAPEPTPIAAWRMFT